MMKKLYNNWLRLFAVVMVMAIATATYAQKLTVSGTVLDETGQPVPGVSILEKGTTNGTTSDTGGKYTLSLSSGSSVLVFSFIGYKTQEVDAANRAVVDVSLEADVTSLNEVIVTGYSSERKQDIVSAVSTISTANNVAIPVSNVEQSIQGRVAGVQVTTSGQPGAPAQVRIRGFGSLTNNTPLYIVDGVPTYDISNLNPYDIETTTILKDAGAASIYGARAASGVVVYTTKHGKNDGNTHIDFDMSTGINTPGKGIGVLNPQQQANKVYEALRNGGATTANQPYGSDINNPVLPDYINVGVKQSDGSWKPTGNINEGDPSIAAALASYNVDPSKGAIIQVVKANKGGTDWYKAMTRNAPVNRFSLGMSGGNERSHYYLNLAYYNQQGIALNTYLKRYNLRLNSEFKPAEHVRIGENLQLSYRDNPQIGNQQNENQLNFAYRMPTIIPVHDVNGGWAGTAAPGFNNPANPVANLTRLNKNYNKNNGFNVFGNAYVEVDPIKHLTIRSSIGGTMSYSYFSQLGFRTYENAENTSSNVYSEGYAQRTSWVFTNTARYQNKFGDHGITALAGYEALKDPVISRFIQGTGLNPFSTDPNYLTLSNTDASGRTVGSGIPNFGATANQTNAINVADQPRTLASYFGKLDYNFKEKYYISGTFRHDASSAFGVQNRSGVFPAVSGAWRISSESFMQGNTIIDDLKLRGGWGVMGNQNIPATNQYTLYNGGPVNGYDISGTNTSVAGGFVPGQVGNPAGKWEKNTTTNIGLDATLLHGTLDVVFEVWQKKTTGLLYNPNFSATAGVYAQNPFVNIASMTNKGIDLQITKRLNVTSDLQLTIDGNISPLKNKITAIAPGVNYFDGATFRNLTFNRNSVGQSLASFYGYQMVGYFRNAADVSASAKQDGAAPGRFKFKDVNGDGVIDDKDRVYMGSPIPKFTYGLNLTAKYKNFTLNAFFYGKYGNKIINFSKWYNDFYQSFSGAALSSSTLHSWTAEHPDGAKTPIVETASNFSTNSQANSWYMESGSYFRLRNLQLNYDLPAGMLSKYGVQKFRVYLQGVNLFTITKYTGKDPEVASSVDTTLGVDVGNYPATRIYSLGFNIGF
ncbi:MAG TPA: TonB-dependent receptor [Cyclobacteriaceae bacterium]|nr:TonB-dependent receptor [Cyclobacteriaceae bacterium]